MAGEVLTPFAASGPITLGRAELDDRLGADAAAHLHKLGLVADALDDVAGEFVLREVPQAEDALGKLTAPRD